MKQHAHFNTNGITFGLLMYTYTWRPHIAKKEMKRKKKKTEMKEYEQIFESINEMIFYIYITLFFFSFSLFSFSSSCLPTFLFLLVCVSVIRLLCFLMCVWVFFFYLFICWRVRLDSACIVVNIFAFFSWLSYCFGPFFVLFTISSDPISFAWPRNLVLASLISFIEFNFAISVVWT